MAAILGLYFWAVIVDIVPLPPLNNSCSLPPSQPKLYLLSSLKFSYTIVGMIATFGQEIKLDISPLLTA